MLEKSSPDIIFHRMKFQLWDFARTHPFLGKPIRAAGKYFIQREVKKYQRKLTALGKTILPKDRYLRAKEIPTQVIVISNGRHDSDSIFGIRLMLNHLKIPYRMIDMKAYRTAHQNKDQHVNLVISCEDMESISEKQSTVFQDRTHVLFPRKPPDIGKDFQRLENTTVKAYVGPNHFLIIDSDPARLLPHRDGLRSLFFADILSAIKHSLSTPLITGMLPPYVGLRIDDVKGEGCENYLPILIKSGWKPNLGIFLEDLLKSESNAIEYFSDLAKKECIEFSPHSFTANRFIFFDYPKGIPLNKEQFEKTWKYVRSLFASWKLPISKVINAHFHVISKSCIEHLCAEGIRYFFSELPPDSLSPVPDPTFFPMGNPVFTTGQDNHDEFLQIYSGDPASTCTDVDSLYDFLMHSDLEKGPDDPVSRIMKRLELSLNCGFAAFLTTHEYLLNDLDMEIMNAICNNTEDQIRKLDIGPVKKVPMSALGESCSEHRNVIIHSVKTYGPNKWGVELVGRSEGLGVLSIVGKGKTSQFVPIPSFTEQIEIPVEI
jgi:hypothetical protein